MTRTTITAKHLTTVPKEVRDHLGAGPADELVWEVEGNTVRVSLGSPAFLRHRGAIRVGPGSVLADVGRARKLRGKERW